MKLEIQHLRGAGKGRVDTFDSDVVRIGRHPSNDLRLDPRVDLDASAFHAELRWEADGVWLVDLDSTNGTLVNGQRVSRHRLANGDRVAFAPDGPEVRVGFESAATPATRVTATGGRTSEAAPTAIGHKTVALMIQDAMESARGRGGLGSTTTFVRQVAMQAARHSSRRQRLTMLLLCGLVLTSLGFLVHQQRRSEARITALQQELARSYEALSDLEADNRAARETLAAMRGETAESEGRGGDVDRRIRQLETEIDRRERLVEAMTAEFNRRVSEANSRAGFEQVYEASRAAVYLLAVRQAITLVEEVPPGKQVQGQQVADFRVPGREQPVRVRKTGQTSRLTSFCTGFAVLAAGWIATNAHCVEQYDAFIEEARQGVALADGGGRVAGILAGEDSVELLAIRNEAPQSQHRVVDKVKHPAYTGDGGPDVGLLRVATAGGPLPSVLEIADRHVLDSLRIGSPIAVLGFPGLTQDPERPSASWLEGGIGRLLDIDMQGVVDPADAAVLQISAGVSHGNSGSPILGAEGKVVGVAFAITELPLAELLQALGIVGPIDEEVAARLPGLRQSELSWGVNARYLLELLATVE